MDSLKDFQDFLEKNEPYLPIAICKMVIQSNNINEHVRLDKKKSKIIILEKLYKMPSSIGVINELS